MQRVKAQIDCGAMSIFLPLSLLRKLDLPYEPAFTSPWPGDNVCRESNGQSVGSVLEHLKLVDELEVLVSCPNDGTRPSLGRATARNLDIDCTNGRMTALRGPNGPQRAKILEAGWISPLPERGEEYKNHKSRYRIQSSHC
jgi:hypothetical protein